MSINFLVVLLVCASPVFAAFGAASQWDVRTTGSDSNGGAFDTGVAIPGTDYSQQNSAQVAFTDLVVGATTTQGTSVLNPFATCVANTSGYCGNVINITGGAGCTVQRVEVLSTATITATFDKSLGTAASVCTGNLGGSLATWLPAVVAVGFNKIWIKSGSYTQTTVWSSSSSNAITVIGYGTTHGDFGAPPVLSTATNSTVIASGDTSQTYINIQFSNTAVTRAVGFFPSGGNSSIIFVRCKLSGFTDAINGDNVGAHFIYNRVSMVDSEVTGNSIHGVINNNDVIIIHSWVHDNTTVAGEAVNSTTNITSIGSLYSNNTGVSGSGALYATGNWVAGGGAGIIHSINNAFFQNSPSGIVGQLVDSENSIFYGQSRYAIEAFSGTTIMASDRSNAFGSNATGNINGSTIDSSDFLLTVNPFTASGSNNYTLNGTTGGGASLAASGYPGTTPFGIGAIGVGPLQNAIAAAVPTGSAFAWMRN